MKFRRLYWVTEQLDECGCSEVAGVFTSIPDLVEEGIRWNEDIDKRHSFRVTLVKLDSQKKPFGSWTSPDFKGMQDDLREYIKTEEFTIPDCEGLVNGLKALAAPTA